VGSVELADIESARERIAGVALITPVIHSQSFTRLLGREVWLKAENLQRTGSFKIRGALNALSLLPPERRAAGVVAASAGNHAQGVALAARELGLHSTVFMPATAAIPKVEATRAYGADIRLGGDDLGAAVDAATAFADQTGAWFVHPYDDPAIVAGQGTLGLELADQVPDADAVVIPVGGGGLIAGSSLALRSRLPGLRIVGVQSAAAPTYVASRRAGEPVSGPVGATVADGIAVGRACRMAYDLIEAHVDDLVTIDDGEATEAVALLLERAKLLVEPSGAVTLAATLRGAVGPGDGPVVVVLSGGNVDLLVVGDLVRAGLEERGRFMAFTVRVRDVPGQLARVLEVVGANGGNIVDVEHHREGSGLPYGQVEIHVAVATRSSDHQRQIVEALQAGGLDVQRGHA
jgi:threonine dehydratase